MPKLNTTHENTLDIYDFFEFCKGKAVQECYLLTYCADFHFFETQILPYLSSYGKVQIPPVILLDDRKYESYFLSNDGLLTGIGSSYHAVPIQSITIFHPKIYLYRIRNRVRLAVGSGNLTLPGIRNNAEIFAVIEVDLDRPEVEATVLIHQVLSYILDLLKNKEQALMASHTKNLLDRCLTINEWEEYESGEMWFLTNRGKSILEQIEQKIPVNNIDRLTITSPFFEESKDGMEQILSGLTAKKYEFVIQDGTSTLNLELVKNLQSKYPIEVKIFPQELEDRYIHAKILAFQTTRGNYLFWGSPNFTLAGLGGKNQEAGILIYLGGEKTDYLFKGEFTPVQVSDLDVIRTQPIMKMVDTRTEPVNQINITRFRINKWLVEIDFDDNQDLSDFKEIIFLIPGLGVQDKVKNIKRNSCIYELSHQVFRTIRHGSSYYFYLQLKHISGQTFTTNREWLTIAGKMQIFTGKRRIDKWIDGGTSERGEIYPELIGIFRDLMMLDIEPVRFGGTSSNMPRDIDKTAEVELTGEPWHKEDTESEHLYGFSTHELIKRILDRLIIEDQDEDTETYGSSAPEKIIKDEIPDETERARPEVEVKKRKAPGEVREESHVNLVQIVQEHMDFIRKTEITNESLDLLLSREYQFQRLMMTLIIRNEYPPNQERQILALMEDFYGNLFDFYKQNALITKIEKIMGDPEAFKYIGDEFLHRMLVQIIIFHKMCSRDKGFLKAVGTKIFYLGTKYYRDYFKQEVFDRLRYYLEDYPSAVKDEIPESYFKESLSKLEIWLKRWEHIRNQNRKKFRNLAELRGIDKNICELQKKIQKLQGNMTLLDSRLKLRDKMPMLIEDDEIIRFIDSCIRRINAFIHRSNRDEQHRDKLEKRKLIRNRKLKRRKKLAKIESRMDRRQLNTLQRKLLEAKLRLEGHILKAQELTRKLKPQEKKFHERNQNPREIKRASLVKILSN